MVRKFEDEMAVLLKQKGIEHTDNTKSFKRADFDLHGPQGTFGLEVKQKNTPIDPMLWHIPAGWDPIDVFILDELTLRRMIGLYGDKWGLAVRTEDGRYYFAGCHDLVLMPREKAKRLVEGRKGSKDNVKGKLIFNLMNFSKCNELADILVRFRVYVGHKGAYMNQIDSWSFVTESVEFGGTRRTVSQRHTDCESALSGYRG